jgi:hypothetical protein
MGGSLEMPDWSYQTIFRPLLAGTMVSIGVIYAQLARYGLSKGQIAHDRAGFGGALLSNALAILYAW